MPVDGKRPGSARIPLRIVDKINKAVKTFKTQELAFQCEPGSIKIGSFSVAHADIEVGVAAEKRLGLPVDLSLLDTLALDSSFGRLRHFAVDRLKIDQSFMTRLIDCSDDRAIAAAIIAMSRSLRISVTAEGVENFPQLLFLQEHACHEAQGYLFSRALPAADAHNLLCRAAEATGTRTQRLRSLIG